MSFYEQDYIMRQIGNIAAVIAKILFNKETPAYIVKADEGTLSNLLYFKINDLLERGELKDAEDAVLDALERGNIHMFEVAVDFYFRVNEFADDTLERQQISRERLCKGLRAAAVKYGLREDNFMIT